MSRPLCFDRMPSRSKPSGGRALIDFDAVYQDRIHPAVRLAGSEPPRRPEATSAGPVLATALVGLSVVPPIVKRVRSRRTMQSVARTMLVVPLGWRRGEG